MQAEYEYQELPHPDSVRLLLVHHSSDATSPLRCSMSATSLAEPAAYTALSYSWGMQNGDASLCYSILVDLLRKPVTRNLFDGLMRLRYSSRDLCMWIDAVCIDQSNMVERSSQVAMMSRIYASAQHVTIWLGNGTKEDDECALPLLRCLREAADAASGGSYAAHNTDEHAWTDSQGRRSTVCERLEFGLSAGRSHGSEYDYRLQLDSADDCYGICGLLAKFFGRRYWSRQWIVQEIYSAKHATVHWGDSSMPLADVQTVAQYLNDFPPHSKGSNFQDRDIYRKSGDTPDHRLFQLTDKLRMLLPRTLDSPDNRRWQRSLVNTVSTCTRANMACSDPRDKVFSLLSLGDSHGLYPDYTKSKCEVYTQFARALIEQGLLPGVLRNVQESDWNRRDKTLPSWVPDLEVRFRSHHFAGGPQCNLAKVDTDGHLVLRPYYLATLLEIIHDPLSSVYNPAQLVFKRGSINMPGMPSGANNSLQSRITCNPGISCAVFSSTLW